jgi:hypothetical protein
VSWRGPRSLTVTGAAHAARRLAWTDWTVLATATVVLPAAALALKLVNLTRLLHAAQMLAGRRRPTGDSGDAERIVRLVDAAAAWCVPTPTCLARAMVAFVLVRRRGIPARLVIGITKARGPLEGHAWVEPGTAPVATREAGAYVPLLVVDGPGLGTRVARGEPAT